MTEQEPILPGDLRSSIYAAWIIHHEDPDISVFNVCVIPVEYMDAAEKYWDRLTKDDKENPLPPGVIYWIPGD